MTKCSDNLEITVIFFFLDLFFFFRDRVSQCSPGCSGTHSVDQAGLELRIPPASASQSAGITAMHHHRPATLRYLNQRESMTPALNCTESLHHLMLSTEVLCEGICLVATHSSPTF